MTNKEKLSILSKMYAEAAENGNGFLFNGWDNWTNVETSPNIESNLADWKVAPKSKTIDLSWAIASGVDTVFYFISKEKCPLIGKLTEIREKAIHKYLKGGSFYTRCEFRTDNWIFHEGQHTIPPDGLDLEIMLRDGACGGAYSDSGSGIWDIQKQGNDIIAYKIIGLEEGWIYPWENKW